MDDILDRLRARKKYSTGLRKKEGMRVLCDAIAEIERLRVKCGELEKRKATFGAEIDEEFGR